MPITYQSAVDSLFALGPELANKTRRKFDLDHMRRLMAAMGDPERRFPSILVAGTNGKGSTAALTASILRVSGRRTGLYTSPHLVEVNERIRVDDEPIGDAEFAVIHSRVEETAQRLVASGELPFHPSFFEMMTAMAFEYFASRSIDIAVLEVGLGGRLDATNIIEPAISIITDIALDHQEWLGETITEIAREKAGIIHANGVVILLPQHPDANEALGRTVLSRGARAISAVEYMPHSIPQAGFFGESIRPRQRYSIEIMGRVMEIESSLLGGHQVRNIALAVAACTELTKRFGYAISPDHIAVGISRTVWPGRFEVFAPTDGSPEIVLDVAHNPAGAWALRSSLSHHYPDRDITMLFGCMRDKPIAELACILFPLAHRVIVTQVDNPRAATPREVAEAGDRVGTEITLAPSIGDALASARSITKSGGLIVITGSVYLVGAALSLLRRTGLPT